MTWTHDSREVSKMNSKLGPRTFGEMAWVVVAVVLTAAIVWAIVVVVGAVGDSLAH